MSQHHRLRAPTGNGEVLAEPGFDAIPKLVEENRRKLDRDDVLIGGMPLRELRALARREVLELVSRDPESSEGSAVSSVGPLLLAGHQPELSHPGVWVKNFALNGLAKKVGGIPLNLIVDNDTVKSTSLRFPVIQDHNPNSVHIESVPYDKLQGELPYEDRHVIDEELFRSVWYQFRELWRVYEYESLLVWAWLDLTYQKGTMGERFTATRRIIERKCGCNNLELAVSRLSQTEAFCRFSSHILGELPRFREVYNAALRAYRYENGIRSANHPASELGEGEAPFWVRSAAGQRVRATSTSGVDSLRPRALTLTLFARVCLGDFFIHGIGGGKYDEVTDAIIRDYFGIEPPAYQVLSATLHLPLPGFPSTDVDVTRAERRVRDLMWNPQRYANADAEQLVAEKLELAASEPPHCDHAARREWFRALQRATERLRPFVADQLPRAEAELARIRAEANANAILKRRDYSWVLYPEETLRPFLQQFLEV